MIRLGDVRAYFELCGRFRLDLDSAFSRAMVPEGAGDGFGIGRAQFNLIILNVMRDLDDETHGIGARPLKGGSSTVALHALCGCHDLEGAIRVLVRFFQVAGSPLSLELRVDGETATLGIQIETRHDADGTFIEAYWLGWIWVMLCWFVGEWLPVAFQVKDGWDPFGGQAHHPRFDWRRGGDVTHVRFPVRLMKMPKRVRNTHAPLRDAFMFLERAGLGSVYAELPPELRSYSSAGDLPDLVTASEQAGVSVSTLSRRLRSTGRNFRQIKLDQRIALATSLLRETELPVEQIAEQVGYAEPRSFRRFIKAATGRTPVELRRDPMPFDAATNDRVVHLLRAEIVDTLNF